MDDLQLYGGNDNEFESLVKEAKIASRDVGMLFGFDKSVVLKIERGSQVHCEGIHLGDSVLIEEAYEKGNKDLGNLGKDDICQEKMKEKVQKEYYKRVREVLKSKLNG